MFCNAAARRTHVINRVYDGDGGVAQAVCRSARVPVTPLERDVMLLSRRRVRNFNSPAGDLARADTGSGGEGEGTSGGDFFPSR